MSARPGVETETMESGLIGVADDKGVDDMRDGGTVSNQSQSNRAVAVLDGNLPEVSSKHP